VLVVLFERPPLMRDAHELGQRSRRGERHQVVLAPEFDGIRVPQRGSVLKTENLRVLEPRRA
jgi:hypothetical protein